MNKPLYFLACIGSFGKDCGNNCSYGYYGHGCRKRCSCSYQQKCDPKEGCVEVTYRKYIIIFNAQCDIH